MNNEARKNIHSARVILVLLVLTAIAASLFTAYDPDFSFITFIAGVSTLFVALLTVFYVITTNQQFSVMESQLEEMQKSRELQAQPLPTIQVNKVYLETPNLSLALFDSHDHLDELQNSIPH